MTRPAGKNDDGWLAANDAERDAIGTNEGLNVGDKCRMIDTDAVFHCTSVDGADASTWTGDATLGGASPILDMGDGTGAPRLIANKGGASEIQFPRYESDSVLRWAWHLFSSEDLGLRGYDSSGVLQHSMIVRNSDGDFEFPGAASFAGLAVMSFDGTAQQFEKTSAAEQRQRWRSDGFLRWQWKHQSDERMVYESFDAAGINPLDILSIAPNVAGVSSIGFLGGVINMNNVAIFPGGVADVGASGSPFRDGFFSGGLGIHGAAVPAQAADPGAFTDNSGGAATNNVIQALTDPADAPATADALRDDLVANLIPELRNNIRELLENVNELRAMLSEAAGGDGTSA